MPSSAPLPVARKGAAGATGVRNRIEHAQLLHPDDIARLSRLGIVASMQPLHATSDMLIAERYWGARCRGAYAWKSLLDAGAALAFGSDCPVEICDPLAGIHAAVTRRRADGSPGAQGWRPEQRLTVEQAVHAYTLGAAFAAGWESDLGSIRVGQARRPHGAGAGHFHHRSARDPKRGRGGHDGGGNVRVFRDLTFPRPPAVLQSACHVPRQRNRHDLSRRLHRGGSLRDRSRLHLADAGSFAGPPAQHHREGGHCRVRGALPFHLHRQRDPAVPRHPARLFFIAGGILMFIVSIDLLLGKPGRTKTSGSEAGEERDDVSIFPLAIPMLAGPGAITTVLLYVSEDKLPSFIPLVLAGSVALALAMAGGTMLLSSFFLRVLGRTGVSVIERIMGIVLTGLSVQFVYDGLLKLGVAGAIAPK